MFAPPRNRRTVYENALRYIYKDKMVDLPDLPKWWLDKVIFWEGQKFQKWPFWDVQELITLWPKLNYNWVIKDAPVYLHMFFRYHHANSSWRVTVKSSFVKIHEGFLFLQFYIDYELFHNVTVLLHWLMKAYSDRYTTLTNISFSKLDIQLPNLENRMFYELNVNWICVDKSVVIFIFPE